MGGDGKGIPLSVSEGESNAVVSSTRGEGANTVFIVVICITSSGDMASTVPRGGGEGNLGGGGVCGSFDMFVSVGAMRWPGSQMFASLRTQDAFAE